MLEVANFRGGGLGVISRFRIQENRFHNCPQVPVFTLSVVGEDLGDTANIGWSGIARNEVLNELSGYEWTDVRIPGDIIEGILEVVVRRLSRRQSHALQ